MGEDLAVSRAGKLGASIGVDDKSSSGTTLAERHAQGGDHETGIRSATTNGQSIGEIAALSRSFAAFLK